MAAHRKSERHRDDLCAGELRKCERQNFSRSFSTVTWIFDAKQRNGMQKRCIWSDGFSLVELHFAKACKAAQKLFLQLEIRCSIRLSYWRRISTEIYRVWRQIKALQRIGFSR